MVSHIEYTLLLLISFFLDFKELPYDLKELLEQKKLNLKVGYFFYLLFLYILT